MNNMHAEASKPAAAQEAVAVVGSCFSLHWIGTGPVAAIIEAHGLKVGDKLYAAPVAAAPVRPSALTASIAELDAFLGGDCVEPLTLAQSESAALILQELKRLMASTPAAPGIDITPRPMGTAPRDGTMVRLLVQFDDHATEDTESPAWTIGACNDDNVGDDEHVGWQFAGWCWDHDHFTEGKGTPVGWLPLLDASPKGGSDVTRGVTVERLEDMSVRGRLKLFAEEDGDMCLMIVEGDGTSAGIEFCASGGRSPRTLEAVRALSRAMEQDNAERPINRAASAEVGA
ncbi:hypothetical protein [uncultured Stenotrophomonas sp.]|uniref:hypothetical protein n=1 Tax=uncultured Stenotrophomonas sp. TaxID=165438 RepID=UPI0025DC95F6|nr:hypothetical protein [uncultured Stenotrophomonas sp.]